MIYDTAKYLERIGITEAGIPSFELLKKLHRANLYNIPFENLSIHYNEKIVLDRDYLFQKIVIKKRGGFCYELNYLFYSLLESIGFNAKIISARVFDDKDIYGPEFDHMAVIVKLEDKEYLCDVGFGDSFIEPVEYSIDKDQEDNYYMYRISTYDGHYFLLARSQDKETWDNQYLFTPLSRSVNEFNEMCTYHQTSPDSHFTQKKVCTIPSESGRITLSGNKLILTDGRNKQEIHLEGEAEFQKYLKQYFNFNINKLKESV